MNKLRLLIVTVIVVALIFVAQCLYTVKPYQDVVQLRFGKVVEEPFRLIEGYNLYLKWPSFVDKVVPIDKRLQVTDAVLETISTSSTENRNFEVSAACSGFWKVTKPGLFYTSLLSQYKDSIPEPGSSYPQKVNEQVRNIIRSSVNTVFGETRLSELFGLPELTGTVDRDCLSIDGKYLLPEGLEIRGGEIKRSDEEERARIDDQGKIIRKVSRTGEKTPCVTLTLYGYNREFRPTTEDETQGARSDILVLSTDPYATEGLGRKELTLTIPLKYVANPRTTQTVRIGEIQEEVARRVTAQTDAHFGVQVVRVEIRRLSFPASNIAKVYENMKAERNTVAGSYTSSGEREANIMLSEARYLASREVSEAEGEARRIRGLADAQAVDLAAKVQESDPEFYNWLQSLEAAAEILKNKAWVVLSIDQPVLEALLGHNSLTPDASKTSPSKR